MDYRKTWLDRRVIRWVVICLVMLIGTLGGLAIGVSVMVGYLTPWHRLPTPPDKPVKIIAGQVGDYPGGWPYRGRPTVIYIQTVSQKIYSCCEKSLSGWVERSAVQAKEINFRDCKGQNQHVQRHLSREIDVYDVNWCGEWDWGEADYAIRNDGTIWVWSTYGRFPDWTVPVCGGPLIGMMLASLLVTVINRRSRRSSIEASRSV